MQLEITLGPWGGYSYQKCHWFYDHKNWDNHFKHFLVLGPLYVTRRSKEHESRGSWLD